MIKNPDLIYNFPYDKIKAIEYNSLMYRFPNMDGGEGGDDDEGFK